MCRICMMCIEFLNEPTLFVYLTQNAIFSPSIVCETRQPPTQKTLDSIKDRLTVTPHHQHTSKHIKFMLEIII